MQYPEFRSALITGASNGIGAALARALAGPERTLTITGRSPERLDAVAASCRAKGATVHAFNTDVIDRVGMDKLVCGADARSPLDLVIANAGISGGRHGRWDDAKLAAAIIDVNVTGVMNTVLPAIGPMQDRKSGRIAIVSSIAGFRGLPTAPTYSASKVAVKAWGEAIRPLLAEQGVGLSVICPGFVESAITAENDFEMPFLMGPTKAAEIILKGLAAGKRTIVFPWQMHLLMRLLAVVPGPIFDTLSKRGPRKA